MKTTDILKKLKKENIRIPKDWAVMQTPSGNFVRFIKTSRETVGKTAESGVEARKAIEKELEKYIAEKQAVKESRLLKIK